MSHPTPPSTWGKWRWNGTEYVPDTADDAGAASALPATDAGPTPDAPQDAETAEPVQAARGRRRHFTED